MVTSDFTKQEYSSQDFLRLIEHRIRKEIRQNGGLSTKKSYQLREQSSLQSQVLSYFLKQIFEERLNLSGEEIIETDYLELFISKRLDVFLKGKPSDSLFEKTMAPLRTITEHEMHEVTKILSLKGEFEAVDSEIISKLQEKYSQSKPSFLKSFTAIESLLKK